MSGLIATGTLSLSGTLLAYSFSPTYIAADAAVSLQVKTLTNTSTSGTYTAEVATNATASSGAALPVYTGLTTVVSLSPSNTANAVWRVSKTGTGVTAVHTAAGSPRPSARLSRRRR